MRCTQLQGLSPEAAAFLDQEAEREAIVTCPKCGEMITEGYVKRGYASAASSGMFDDGPELFEYTLTNGDKVREIVQAVPWSSGPCIFLCLERDGKNIFEWPEDEINNA